MAAEWKKYKLGELCYSVSETYRCHDDKVVLINTSDVLNGKILNHEEVENKNLKGQFKKTFKQNDILYSEIRPANKRFAYVDIENPFNYIASTKLMVLRSTDKILPKFLFILLTSEQIITYLQAMAETRSGTFPQITYGAELAPIIVNVPDIETQEKIVKILSSLDEKIELNNKMNENLHAQAQAIFSEYYNKGTEKLLGDVVNEIESGSRQKGGAVNEGVPSIGAEKIEQFGIYDFSKEKYISNEFFNKLKKGVIKNGDVLLYKDGAYTGKVSMALNGFPYEKCAVNEHVFIIRGKENYINQFYLYFCLFDSDNKAKIHSLASSKVAQPGLNQEELKSLIVKVPGVEDMLNFEKTVSPMMNIIAYNAIQNQKLAQIRDTLLPKLMSGELEV